MKLKKIEYKLYQAVDNDSDIKVGQHVTVEKAKKERSNPEHNLVFSVARKVLENISTKTNVEDFIKTTMLHLGYCKKFKMNGKLYEIPFSLKFIKMNQDDFHKMSKDLFEAWALLLKCSVDELVDSVCDVD